ncbi:MAG: cytochrome C oxidase subunit IV family protein [Pseudomonadales bacterium]|nr:cytochrome C oxidase subunit IV family protein [Pseudomonadales bacterium]
MTESSESNPMKYWHNSNVIWVAMMLLTLFSYFIGEVGSGGLIAMLVVLIAAAVKSVLIIREFMELRGVSFLWRAIMYGWLLVVCTGIGVAYLIGIWPVFS